MFQIDFTENVKTFYFATGIPIAVLKNGRVVNSRPASVQTAENMAEEGSSISVGYRIQDYSSVQYVTSDYGEKFLIEVLHGGGGPCSDRADARRNTGQRPSKQGDPD